MKEKLCISFSGGRTSAVMTKLCMEQYKDKYEMIVTFANTGCEHEETLKFVDMCDKHFGWNVVWLEAVVNPQKGKGIRHRVVDFNTASRKGEPFEAVVKKYGISNANFPNCTRDLKEYVINSYFRSIGWKKREYYTAIGIRADEMDRVSSTAKDKKFIYPLVTADWTKEMVKNECATWPFDLQLKGEHWGNCVWCWKKSLRKLMTLALEDETIFDFPNRLEKAHCMKARSDKFKGPFYFFRSNNSAEDILKMAKTTEFEPYSDKLLEKQYIDPARYILDIDLGSSCGESCEIGADKG